MAEEKEKRIKQVKDLIESGICDPSRLYHILGMLEGDKPLYNSDNMYLSKMNKKLEEKIQELQKENSELGNIIHKERSRKDDMDITNEQSATRTSKKRTLIDDAEIDRILDAKTQKRDGKVQERKNDKVSTSLGMEHQRQNRSQLDSKNDSAIEKIKRFFRKK